MGGKFPFLFLVAVLAMGVLLLSAPALADRIDGNWCYKTRTMSIDGPNIVTPGGTRMTGLYDRHGFRYVVPAGEADAGSQVDMVQFDEYTIQVTTIPGGTAGAARTEIWKRCDLTT
jgi:hypothetical protein